MNEENKQAASLSEEKEVVAEIKKEEKMILGLKKNLAVTGIVAALALTGLLVGLIYWHLLSGRISIDNAMISAPQVDLTAKTAGPLEEVFVNEGDQVNADAVLARVGNELIKAKTGGLIVSVKKDLGQLFSPGTPVVSMIDPGELRVVGQIDENKGLADVAVGQTATFTVDAFGSQKFVGVVDEIKPTADDSSVVFSISDKREIKKFDVKIRYNNAAYPQFKNGMSAKIVIYKN